MRTRVQNNKEQIFCEWRHRWVRLTPEEWIRQQLLHRMVSEGGYPASLIAVEVPLQKLSIVNSQFSINQRCDAVVYANLPSLQGEELCSIERPVDGHRTSQGRLSPLMLIECKAETVPLTQKTLDQAITYNRKLNVPYLLLSNGAQTICIDGNNNYSSGFPRYTDLLRCE